jgi:hypothetical protein
VRFLLCRTLVYRLRAIYLPRVVLTIVELIFGRMDWFVNALGFFALGLESTLPLPQLYRQDPSPRHISSTTSKLHLNLVIIVKNHCMASVCPLCSAGSEVMHTSAYYIHTITTPTRVIYQFLKNYILLPATLAPPIQSLCCFPTFN